MQPATLFWLTFAPIGVAALVALVGDMLGGRAARAGVAGTAVLLLGSSVVGLVGGYMFPLAAVWGGQFIVGAGMSTVVGLISVLGVVALSGRGDGRSNLEAQDAALVALCAGGSALAATTTSLLTLALALETAAVSGYALVARSRTRRSSEAAMKYLVQGAVATGLLILGYAMFVSVGRASGAYSTLGAVAEKLPPAPMLAGCVLVMAALAFKIGAAPLHSWAPDAYETAPAPAAAFLAGSGKLAAVLALSTFVVSVGIAIPSKASEGSGIGTALVPVLALLATVSVLIGSLLALRQRSYTRMLGYAGVAQAGYAIIAVAALNPTSALVFTTTYALGTACAFMAADEFRRVAPDWDGSIEGLAGTGRKSPALGLAVSLSMVSLAGVPPLLGFWGKFHAFGAAVVAGANWISGGQSVLGGVYIALVVAGVVGSVISVAYYGSVMKAMYFGAAPVASDGEDAEVPTPAPRVGAAVLVLAGALLVSGMLPVLLGFSATLKGFLLGG
jgi:NADH-quinone oxidoreductase subunit N